MKQLGICTNLAIRRVFKVTSLKIAFIFSILWVIALFGILPLIVVLCSHNDISAINPLFAGILLTGMPALLFATFPFLFSVIENNELTLIFSRPIKRTTYIYGKIWGSLLLSLISVVIFIGLLTTWTILNRKNGISFDTLYKPLGVDPTKAKGIGDVGCWIVTLFSPFLWVTIGVCFGTLLGFVVKRRWQNLILTLVIIIPWLLMIILPLLFTLHSNKMVNFIEQPIGGWVFCVIIPVGLWIIFAIAISGICKNKAKKQNIRA